MVLGGLKALINISVFASVPLWVIEISEHVQQSGAHRTLLIRICPRQS